MKSDEKLRLVLDTDAGIDGAIALLYALADPGIRLEGVTTARGATSASHAAERALRLVRLIEPGCDADVAAGAESPLERGIAEPDPAAHGRGGLGDVLLPPSDRTPAAESAAAYLARKANEAPGQIALVLAGPTTNWALAVREDPGIGTKFKSVFVAGGTVLEPGDATPVAEANFHADPESAAILFRTAEPLTAIGLDVSAKLTIGRSELERMEPYVPAARSRAVRLLARLIDYRARHPLHPGQPVGRVPLRAAAAVLAAASPEPFVYREWYAEVAAEGGVTAGMVVADRRSAPDPAAGRRVRFGVDVVPERALHRFMTAFMRE
ncbi:nucleoside hydrolase [Cohnella xylanilytica]|uniref:Nucleoside hydrolase n=1 Tax=Cohnella xylanilytica TaxID=557555 RepID=A0A841U5C3_9BACL|nr:nucleoside hydrolase [Cohnella xylanilytica]MBB6695009.1 nucleoside hydrolase [Cohnella xylanilytica]